MAGDGILRVSPVRWRSQAAGNEGPSRTGAGCPAFGQRVSCDRRGCARGIPARAEPGRARASPARGGRPLRKRQLEDVTPVERRPDRLWAELHTSEQGRAGKSGDVLSFGGRGRPTRSDKSVGPTRSDVEVLHIQGVLFDELPAGI